MSSNEDYLDSLLKSIAEDGGTAGKDKNESEKKQGTGGDLGGSMSPEEIEAMFAAVDQVTSAQDQAVKADQDDINFEEFGFGDLNFKDFSETEENSEESEFVQEGQMQGENAEESEFVQEGQIQEESEESEFDWKGLMQKENAEALEFDQEEPVPEENPEEEVGDSAPITLENTRDMSEEEIDRLLSASLEFEEAGEEDEFSPFAEEASSAEDSELNEINDLLLKSDNNEAVDEDMLALLGGLSGAKEESDEPGQTDEEQVPDSKEEKKRKKREKRERRSRNKSKDADVLSEEEQENPFTIEADETAGVKKQGFFGRLLATLTEEDELTEELDENQSIIRELDAEDKAELNKKKNKPAKGKAGKDQQEDSEDEDAGKDKGKGKKKKDTKPAKPKKPKKIKEKPEETEKPGKKIAKKSIVVTVFFGGTILAGILIGNAFLGDVLTKVSAQKAFEEKNYMECFEQLYGIARSKEEEAMLNYSKIVLKMQRRLDTYNQYKLMNQDLEALDSLVKAVGSYDELYGVAQKWNAASEIEVLYSQILGILLEEYQVTEEDARMIADCSKDVDYTRYLTAIISGEGVARDETGQSTEEGLQDVLPEESELPDTNFTEQ